MAQHQRHKRQYPRQSVQEQAALARCDDLEEQLDAALALLHEKGKRIEELEAAQDRRTRQVVAATLRKML